MTTRPAFAFVLLALFACQSTEPDPIDRLLAQMTVAEKVGQMTQYAWGSLTGPASTKPGATEQLIRDGIAGSLLNVTAAADTRRLQQIAVDESRLHIPMVLAYDTIHGFRTTFPVPLAMAASFDPSSVERASEIAGREMRAAGIHWTFAPMVDISRDARWGRVVESFGEDVELSRVMAAASVRGFNRHVITCAKHFVGYGAAESGRDYNTVDLSDARLWNVHLPPFEAALEAGAQTVMAGFHDLNGTPMHGNGPTLTRLLRGALGFDGVVVSDYNGVGELIPHGVAAGGAAAAAQATLAGVDIDMEGNLYASHLAERVRAGALPQKTVDRAVRRILELKQAAGLFTNPYGDEVDPEVTEKSRHAALEMARASIVLLKNDGGLLPVAATTRRIAVVGALANSHSDCLGPWHGLGNPEDAVTILEGIQRSAISRNITVTHAHGCAVDGSHCEIAAAVAAARKADLIIAVVGESAGMSGEAASRTDIGLPGDQRTLLAALHATGRPVVAVLMNGRPLAIPWVAANIPAVVESWFLGIEHGPAVADVLFGDTNPSGRLPVTMPRAVGQAPLYYTMRDTGRPAHAPDAHPKYSSKYLDAPNEGLFVFGHGLSYTAFDYADLTVPESVAVGEDIRVQVRLTNIGTRSGVEVVQLYVRDEVAAITRPPRELKAFERIHLEPSATQTVTFELPTAALAYFSPHLGRRIVEAGAFRLWVGSSSASGLEARFTVTR